MNEVGMEDYCDKAAQLESDKWGVGLKIDRLRQGEIFRNTKEACLKALEDAKSKM